MGRHYDQLSLGERMEIGRLRGAGASLSVIAARLGRSRSTIGRELRRNGRPGPSWSGGYDGERAQRLTARRRQWDARFKLARQPDLRADVKRLLAMGWSPAQIAGRLALRHGRTVISAESIYRFIEHRARQHDRSWHPLLARGKRRRGRFAPRGGSLVKLMKQRVGIQDRPADVAARSEPGHWEGDLMNFRRNRQALLVLHERVSRLTLAFRLPDKTARTASACMTAFFATLPKPLSRSVTFDNGGEFALHHELGTRLGIRTYFCDAKAPWQKGGVENAIGRLRRRLPSRTDLDTLDPKAIDAILDAYNDTPRRVLAFRPPRDVFSELKSVALQT